MNNKKRLICLEKAGFSGLEKFLLLLDIIFCKHFLHVTEEEYFHYNFYNLKNRYRKKFLLIHHQKTLYKKINIKGFTRDKYKAYIDLKCYYGREIIKLPECGLEGFLEFVKRHKKVVIKPIDSSCGQGIVIFKFKDENNAISEYVYLSSKNYVCEEFIEQHDVLSQLNPYSVNTIRVVSLSSEGKVEIISANLRMGNGEKCIDNVKQGGISAVVDINSGVIISIGKTYNNQYFETHPKTGTKILGVKIPNWDEVIKLVENAHNEYKECMLLGWDIAITKNNAVLVEVNNAPGPMIMQYIDKIPKGEKIFAAAKSKLKS